MYKLEDIKQVHLEITENCQAACPMCARTHMGQVNPNLTMAELTLEDCKKIFEPAFLKQLHSIYLCGNYGDPIIAKETLDVLRYCKEQNPKIWLSLHTNGGARSTAWWEELATIIGKQGGVVFGIDGLADTNHLHRKNVNWDILENNVKTFIKHGGIAEWQFIVFEHNQHQVEIAEQLSKDMGFAKFVLVKTNRFIDDLDKPKTFVDMYDKDRKKITSLRPPSEQYVNGALKNKDAVIEKYGSAENYFKETEIVCKVKSVPKIFISAEGLLLPCCWMGGTMYNTDAGYKSNGVWKIIDSLGGKEAINAKNGMQNAFNSGMLDIIQDSWNKKEFSEGRLRVCASKCGKEYNPLDMQRQ